MRGFSLVIAFVCNEGAVKTAHACTATIYPEVAAKRCFQFLHFRPKDGSTAEWTKPGKSDLKDL